VTAGPGKYDDLCTFVRVVTGATAAIVIVLDGHHGSGFSVQATPVAMEALATILESTAKQIRDDLAQMKGRESV
jgi:hypothetical protein